jgi:hypothetical protein
MRAKYASRRSNQIFLTIDNFLSSPLLGAACGEPEQEGGQRAGGSGPTWHRGGHCPRHTAVDSPYLPSRILA